MDGSCKQRVNEAYQGAVPGRHYPSLINPRIPRYLFEPQIVFTHFTSQALHIDTEMDNSSCLSQFVGKPMIVQAEYQWIAPESAGDNCRYPFYSLRFGMPHDHPEVLPAHAMRR
jgi:hypothetical protein